MNISESYYVISTVARLGGVIIDAGVEDSKVDETKQRIINDPVYKRLSGRRFKTESAAVSALKKSNLSKKYYFVTEQADLSWF
jgi:hypothetical protein